MARRDRERLVLRAAQMYYCDNMTQSAIAERLGCTRWTVGRLLQEGKDRGVVTISVDHPQARRTDMEREIQEKYGIDKALIVKTQYTPAQTLALVARVGAEYVEGIRPAPTSISIGWGRATAAMVHAITPGWANDLKIYQPAAIPTHVSDYMAVGPLEVLAKKSSGEVFPMDTPRGVETPSSVAAREHPQVKEVLDGAAAADVIVATPRGLRDLEFLVDQQVLLPGLLEWAHRQGAAGTILGHFIDPFGNPIDHDLENRTYSVTLAEFKAAKHAVVLAHTLEKLEPTQAALWAGMVNVLVADSELARALL